MNAIKQFYADAASRIGSWLIDLPSSVITHDHLRGGHHLTSIVSDQWTLRTAPGAP
ncbi:MAG: hypothetical protein IPI24_13615 [Ignavibacteria bacterium]|nr:hypothetical protein [Ignavibacteria bacterium]